MTEKTYEYQFKWHGAKWWSNPTTVNPYEGFLGDKVHEMGVVQRREVGPWKDLPK